MGSNGRFHREPVSTSEEVTPASVRAQLSRIVESRSFANAPRLCRMLRYLVEQSLAGHESKLRESALGVEVFDRGAGFDPSADTIVRVHARRLRRRLQEYYENEGRSDPVIIDIPKGQYRPRFQPRRSPLVSTWIGWRQLAVAMVIPAALGAALYLAHREEAPEAATPPITQFRVDLPPGTALASDVTNPLAITRNGRRIAMNVLEDNGRHRLYIRALENLEAAPIAGIEGRIGGVWFSPDGEWVVFNDIERGVLRKVPAEGGSAKSIAAMGVRSFEGVSGLSWGPSATLIFSTDELERGLMRVPASGGTPQRFTEPAGGHEHHHPHVLADGSAVLFTLRPPAPQPDRIAVRSLETGAKRVLALGSSPRVTSSGHLLFNREGAVRAVRFDREKLKLIGEPVPVLDGIAERRGVPAFDVAGDGTLVYARSNLAMDAGELDTLVWVGLDGKEVPFPLPPGRYKFPTVAPDGKRVALRVADEKGSAIWISSVERHTLTRLTFGASTYATPVWSPDGESIIYAADHGGTFDLYQRRADGTGHERRLTATNSWIHLPSWSRDGKHVLYVECHDGVLQNCDIGRLKLDEKLTTELLIDEQSNVFHPELSPDGRWLAYMSRESRGMQIFVRPYPEVDARRWQISSRGGELGFWSKDTRTLYFADTLGDQRRMMAVTIGTAPEFVAHPPRALFDLAPYRTFPAPEHIAFEPDSERFLLLKRRRRNYEAEPIVVTQNWLEVVERLTRQN